ncbi:ABC transporter ATP-binding protein [Thermodesulfobacteriota bacterium]
MYSIEVKNLTKEFNGFLKKKRLVAVEDVNLQVEKGEIIGLLGVNGAGKTTLLKMICGLLKPTRGEIFINGQPLKKNRYYMLTQIGAVLEGSRNSLWSMTIQQNLTYFGYLKNTHGQTLKNRGDELLEFFQLKDKKHEVVKNLSKGMKQKLAIVLAFISDPELILLDEPTLGLDINIAKLVKNRIVDLAKQNNKTVFLTTHQIEMVQEICDRVAIINKGRLIAFEQTEKLLNTIDCEQYVIKFKGTADTPALLKGLPMIREAEILKNDSHTETVSMRLIFDRMDSIFTVLEALHRHRITILSIDKSEPNLEDVFVKMIET